MLCPEHSRDPKVRFLLNPPASCLVLPCFISHICLFFSSSFLLFLSAPPLPLLFSHLPFLPVVSFSLSFRFSTPPHLTTPTLVSLQVPADEVCGCPLVRDVFELTGDFCRLPKRQCNRHYCWEKLRRAEVDLERVRVVGLTLGVTRVPGSRSCFSCFLPLPWQWYKLDELFEQERNVRTAMTNRAGLLALMLHQTIQHDPLTTDLRSSADR